jgi:hypothetical protein
MKEVSGSLGTRASFMTASPCPAAHLTLQSTVECLRHAPPKLTAGTLGLDVTVATPLPAASSPPICSQYGSVAKMLAKQITLWNSQMSALAPRVTSRAVRGASRRHAGSWGVATSWPRRASKVLQSHVTRSVFGSQGDDAEWPKIRSAVELSDGRYDLR